MTALNILVFIGILIVLVILHELGHMVVAKACGMRVERFSVFMGRPLWSIRRGETEYGVGWLPLGGYVKITGMTRDEEIPPEVEPRAYYAAKTWKKVATILAGPLVNGVLAFILFACAFWVGVNVREPTTTVGSVQSGTPAASIGLTPGDRLIAVDGVTGGFLAIQNELRAHPGKVVTVRFQRGETVQTVRVRLRAVAESGQRVGKLGFSPALRDAGTLRAGPIEGLTEGWDYTKFVVEENVRGIGRLFTSEKAREDVSSVVGIGAVYNDISENGLATILRFVGLVSLALCIFNLLPLLPLDGGHILFALIEKVRGQPLRREAYERFSMVGFALIMLVFVFALQNDIGRLTGEGFNVR
jgi:regulator of sigma E protease